MFKLAPLIMRCALCLNDRDLCDSHIYPKFTYRRMKEQGEGSFRVFSTSGGKSEGEILQDGFKEKLLCKECEARFQKWEDYFARIVRQKKLLDFKRPSDGKKWVRVDGLDYAKMKLFLLSILWRTQVSKNPRFNPRLGDKHEQRLREMLLNCDPGCFEEYGCVVTVPFVELAAGESEEMRPPVTVTPSNVRRKDGLRVVPMQIDGVLFQYVVGALDVVKRSVFCRVFLKPNGELIVGVEELTKIDFLRDAWGRTLGFT
jgi:hypothetical protein